MRKKNYKISVITPVYNEEGNIPMLLEKISDVLETIGLPYEIIAVNDGSRDNSLAILSELTEKYPNLMVVDLARNYGQTAAMQAAIDHTTGDVIVPIDADLQNDPSDIPKLLSKIEEGFDVVSGWRKDRQDAELKRNFPSRIANRLISRVSGVSLHDYGCSLKAYRRETVDKVRLYGEMHRFIPIYASWYGDKITEIPVTHRKRHSGESKYGLERIFKVLLDLLVVKFLHGPLVKPIYWFGGVGALFYLLTFISVVWALVLKLSGIASFIETPLPIVAALGITTGTMCFLVGLLAEIQIRVYFESRGRNSYQVRSMISLKQVQDAK